MASIHGMNIGVLYGAVDLTTWFSNLSLSRKADTADVTTFGSGVVPKQYIGGPVDATADFDGVWDGNAAAIDDTLAALFGTAATVVSVAWESFATRGVRTSILSGVDTEYDVTGGVSSAVLVKAAMQGSGPGGAGWLLRELIDRTATSAGGAANSTDTTTTSSNGYVAALHVPIATADDTPSLATKLVDSADNSTFADVTGAAFTTLTTTGAQLIYSLTQTVRRYVAATFTIGGTNPHITAAVVLVKRP